MKLKWHYRAPSVTKLFFLCLALYICNFGMLTRYPSKQNNSDGALSAGADVVRGRCGNLFPLSPGFFQQCDTKEFTCCSPRGWCSNSPEDCLCDDCLYYEWEEVKTLIPANGNLVDDN